MKDLIPNLQLGTVTITNITYDPADFAGGNVYFLVSDGTNWNDPGNIPAAAQTGKFIDGQPVYVLANVETDLIKPLVDAMNEGLSNVDLSNMIQGLDKINGLPKEIDKFASRVNSYIEKMANAYVTSLNNHCLTQAIAPWILFNTTNGIERLTYGTKVTPGNMQIMMTSPTEELLVPSYAKYIAVENEEGKIIQSDVLPGKTQQYTLDLNKPGKYFVILSSMDYWGFVINKKYLVEVVAPAA